MAKNNGYGNLGLKISMMYLKVHPHKWKAFANISNLKKLTTLKDSVSEEDLLEESNKSQEKKSKKK